MFADTNARLAANAPTRHVLIPFAQTNAPVTNLHLPRTNAQASALFAENAQTRIAPKKYARISAKVTIPTLANMYAQLVAVAIMKHAPILFAQQSAIASPVWKMQRNMSEHFTSLQVMKLLLLITTL